MEVTTVLEVGHFVLFSEISIPGWSGCYHRRLQETTTDVKDCLSLIWST